MLDQLYKYYKIKDVKLSITYTRPVRHCTSIYALVDTKSGDGGIANLLHHLSCLYSQTKQKVEKEKTQPPLHHDNERAY